MNRKINHFKPINLLTVCGAISVMLSACSGVANKPEPLSEAESCKRLQALIADHPNQFSAYRKNLHNFRRIAVWTADKVFPTADNCQVWEWGAGRFNYVCDWQPKGGQQEALDNFQQGQQIIQSCLAKGWNANAWMDAATSKQIIYSNSALPTIVSLRAYQEKESLSKRWHNTVIIGDRNNLEVPKN